MITLPIGPVVGSRLTWQEGLALARARAVVRLWDGREVALMSWPIPAEARTSLVSGPKRIRGAKCKARLVFDDGTLGHWVMVSPADVVEVVSIGGGS